MKTIFECLSNELLIHLFEYFSTDELFGLFYNLNIRLNNLIESHFHLNYSTEQSHHSSLISLSFPYIRHLSIRTIFPNNKLKKFTNLRSLHLDYLTDDLIHEIKQMDFSQLEYLYLNHKIHPFYMFDMRQLIFSNFFSNLKFCYISRMNLSGLSNSQTCYSLRYLKLNEINGQIYVFILSSCPNLNSFQFKFNTKSPCPRNSICHLNLKSLNINMLSDDWPWNDEILDEYFRCIPNIEQLKISRTISTNVNLVNYDWLSSILSSRFLFLEQFHLKFYLNRSQGFFNKRIMSIEFKRQFSSIYKYQYQYQLVVF